MRTILALVVLALTASIIDVGSVYASAKPSQREARLKVSRELINTVMKSRYGEVLGIKIGESGSIKPNKIYEEFITFAEKLCSTSLDLELHEFTTLMRRRIEKFMIWHVVRASEIDGSARLMDDLYEAHARSKTRGSIVLTPNAPTVAAAFYHFIDRGQVPITELTERFSEQNIKLDETIKLKRIKLDNLAEAPLSATNNEAYRDAIDDYHTWFNIELPAAIAVETKLPRKEKARIPIESDADIQNIAKAAVGLHSMTPDFPQDAEQLVTARFKNTLEKNPGVENREMLLGVDTILLHQDIHLSLSIGASATAFLARARTVEEYGRDKIREALIVGKVPEAQHEMLTAVLEKESGKNLRRVRQQFASIDPAHLTRMLLMKRRKEMGEEVTIIEKQMAAKITQFAGGARAEN